MGVVNRKDIPAKYNMLGQYFTPSTTADFCLDHTIVDTDLVIEPSCGNGIFLSKIRKKWDKVALIGIEVDDAILSGLGVLNINFYDYNQPLAQNVTFIGNPPYRTPAASVTDNPVYGRRDYVRSLAKKYGVTGMREEAVFFILKSVDLIFSNKITGHIYYILPKAIFRNNSRSYKTFVSFLRNNVRLESVWDIGKEFDKVSTDLCYVHFVVDGSRSDTFLHNGEMKQIDEFYGVSEDLIPFQMIFKKTYLGSVPCEGVLMSVRGEPLSHFKKRLYKLIESDVTEDNLIDLLSYNGEVHLAALKKRDPNKVKVVLGYVNEIKRLVELKEFKKDGCYKPIQHRNEIRHYFRHHALKKASFIYQLNPNPTPSFYFPGNPVKGCLDYHGFCAYDVNRNCSPSANRTVPLQGIDNNLTDEFKVYWDENTDLPYIRVFDYLSYILESDWYKGMKTKYQRFYFGVPRIFDKGFLSNETLLA